jgi:hypothetical protein
MSVCSTSIPTTRIIITNYKIPSNTTICIRHHFVFNMLQISVLMGRLQGFVVQKYETGSFQYFTEKQNYFFL